MGLKKIDIRDWRDLAPLEGWAKVAKVYDGDTYWVIININNPLVQSGLDAPNDQLRLVNVRLARVNAPELKGGTADERVKGKASRDYVESLIGGKVVWFRFGNFGLYGGESLDCYHRQIGEIYLANPTIHVSTNAIHVSTNMNNMIMGGSVGLSEHLLAAGYAVPFVPK